MRQKLYIYGYHYKY